MRPTGFHEGEREMQRRTGSEPAARRLEGSIRDHLPPAAIEFLSSRREVIAASLDGEDRPWAAVVSGSAGFARAASPRALVLDGSAFETDGLRDRLRARPQIGLLFMDFEQRRRMRVNGRAAVAADGAVALEIAEAFSNCPKYIQRRVPLPDGEARRAPAAAAQTLDAAQRARIAAADTFYVASAHPERGLDASHRGGAPGFVQVDELGTISWPDYPGNGMFQTLGNALVRARAGLLFLDHATGAALALTGRLAVELGSESAPRRVRFMPESVRDRSFATPGRWRLVEPSPHNPPLVDAPSS
jgi:uncharacterized protein